MLNTSSYLILKRISVCRYGEDAHLDSYSPEKKRVYSHFDLCENVEINLFNIADITGRLIVDTKLLSDDFVHTSHMY